MSRKSRISIALVLATVSCRSRSSPPKASIPLIELYTPAAIQAAAPLEGLQAGPSWQGLSEIYRETLVARAPEIIRIPLTLPSSPWLDLAVGTVDDAPVTFRVGVDVRPSSQFGDPPKALLLEKTLTRGDRWEPAGVDLAAFAGQKVTLTLGLDAASPGTIGLWGSPVVRDRGRPITGGGPRGVILVLADTLRRDHLGAYGNARSTSPHIDRLAAEGATFDACVGHRLPAAETLAEAFRDAGYATASYSSAPVTAQMTNLHQGFEEVHASGSLTDQGSRNTAREYVDRLLPWLSAHRDVPFFVLVHVSDLDGPSKPSAPHDTLFNDDGYDGSIRAMDAELGRLVEHLRALGLADKTLLVFTGARGEDLRDHGELVYVPLIFHFPGSIPAGKRVAETVETIDIVPTLLRMSGLPVPAQGTPLFLASP